jgi:hypothetical protein
VGIQHNAEHMQRAEREPQIETWLAGLQEANPFAACPDLLGELRLRKADLSTSVPNE